VERSGEIYAGLVGRLQEAVPEVAAQVQDEARRGRPVAVKALSPSEKIDRSARLKEVAGPTGRISGADLAAVEYTDDEKLAILVDALRRLGSSMAASREALAQLANRHQITNPTHFRNEGAPEDETFMDLAHEVEEARSVFDQVAEPLWQALEELR